MCLRPSATESEHAFLGANFAGDFFAVARHLANRRLIVLSVSLFAVLDAFGILHH